MFISINKLANQLPKDKPDNRAANPLSRRSGRTIWRNCAMMQYLFQNFNFRGAKPYTRLDKERCWRRNRNLMLECTEGFKNVGCMQ